MRFTVTSVVECRRAYYTMRAKARKEGISQFDGFGLYLSPTTPDEMWLLREALPVGAATVSAPGIKASDAASTINSLFKD